MAETLLFITGVLTGIIVGFLFARRTRGSSAPNGSSERLLEERLSKADEGLEQFSKQLEAQNEELKSQQKQLQEAREAAAISRTQLEGAIQERDALRAAQASTNNSLEEIRAEKERLSKQAAEAAEKLRSQESQTKFLTDHNGSLPGCTDRIVQRIVYLVDAANPSAFIHARKQSTSALVLIGKPNLFTTR